MRACLDYYNFGNLPFLEISSFWNTSQCIFSILVHSTRLKRDSAFSPQNRHCLIKYYHVSVVSVCLIWPLCHLYLWFLIKSQSYSSFSFSSISSLPCFSRVRTFLNRFLTIYILGTYDCSLLILWSLCHSWLYVLQ